jgi:hypothetical protein
MKHSKRVNLLCNYTAHHDASAALAGLQCCLPPPQLSTTVIQHHVLYCVLISLFSPVNFAFILKWLIPSQMVNGPTWIRSSNCCYSNAEGTRTSTGMNSA